MREFVLREPIEKGWSADRKYRVEDVEGQSYLLRVTTGERAATRRPLFALQRRLAGMGVPMCAPLELDEDGEGARVLYEWIDGQDAEDVLPRLSAARQYRYGHAAGEILRTIHSIPAPEDLPDWEGRFNAKIDRKLRAYRECPVRFPGDEAVIACIEAKRALLRGRPQTFQHGDYHTCNLLLDRAGRLVVIDFDRYDFGDPWEEFNRIVWCAQLAPPFAGGMVEGYFGGEPPRAFWELLALYIGVNALSALPWALPFGEGEVRVMLRQAADILSWYDGMQKVVPGWYAPGGACEKPM